MILGIALLAQVASAEPPPSAAFLAVLDNVVTPDVTVVVADSLTREFGPGVPVRRRRSERLSQTLRGVLTSRGMRIDAECEGDACLFVDMTTQRAPAEGQHVIRVETYQRALPVSSRVRVLEFLVSCDASRCTTTRRGPGVNTFEVDVRLRLRQFCSGPAPSDSADTAYREAVCAYLDGGGSGGRPD